MNTQDKDNQPSKQSEPASNVACMTQSPLSIQIEQQKSRLVQMERRQELIEAAKPLKAYLQKYHDPYTQLVVSYDRVEIVQQLVSELLPL